MCFLANTLDRRAHFAFLLVNWSWRAHFFFESASVPAGTSLTGLLSLTGQRVTCLFACSVFIASFADVFYCQIYTYNNTPINTSSWSNVGWSLWFCEQCLYDLLVFFWLSSFSEIFADVFPSLFSFLPRVLFGIKSSAASFHFQPQNFKRWVLMWRAATDVTPAMISRLLWTPMMPRVLRLMDTFHHCLYSQTAALYHGRFNYSFFLNFEFPPFKDETVAFSSLFLLYFSCFHFSQKILSEKSSQSPIRHVRFPVVFFEARFCYPLSFLPSSRTSISGEFHGFFSTCFSF